MDEQLRKVAASYDRGADLGRRGVDLYKNLPEVILTDPDYPLYRDILAAGEAAGDSRDEKIRSFLSPAAGMKFIDLGCSLNLMFYSYDRWPSDYYGVDISRETISLLEEFVTEKKLRVGGLIRGSIHETPFAGGSFDIGACIGVLEYFERDFVREAIREMRRITKPGGKFVLDIPNTGSPAARIMMMIEDYLGRPDLFDLTVSEFEEVIGPYFEIEEKDRAGDTAAMVRYFLRRGE